MKDLLQQPSALIRASAVPRCLILLYHRVVDLKSDPQLLAVSPSHFCEHLQCLQGSYDFVTMTQLAALLETKTLVKNTIAITFDDGYSDNLIYAKPALERSEIPATVYVTTSPCLNRTEFWWDELDGILLAPGELPELLELIHDERVFSWQLGESSTYSQDDFETHRAWNVTLEDTPSIRHEIYRMLQPVLRAAPLVVRERILQYLADWAGRTRHQAGACQTLTEAQIVDLAGNELVEIGSHSVNHPVLSGLESAAQLDEIRQSKTYLEDLLDRPVKSFAYPYGSRGDYTNETIALVKEHNFSTACANLPEVVWSGTDRYQLPRLIVRDCGGEVFSEWIASWFGNQLGV